MHPLLRFTLDLFDSPPAGAPASPIGPGPVKSSALPPPPPVRQPRQPARAPSAEPAAELAHFNHPQASREIQLGHARVRYAFQRGQRRSIGFSVGPDGLAVRAPKWVTLREVDSALQAKAAWILRKLQDTRTRQARQAGQVIDWRDGACLPYLGGQLHVKLSPGLCHGAGGALLESAASDHHLLHISLAHDASPAQIRDRVQAWLMRQARQIFQQRLDHFAPRLGVQWQKLSLSNAATRWGSARADGAIRLNWRLLHFSLPVLDYVVVHELSHLRVMDHSPRFWDIVRQLVPDYPELRQQLKDQAVPTWP